MPINILMPALSPTMEEGKLAKWLVKEGDTVKSGDVIAEIETDKATMEVEAVDEGTVGKIVVPGGTEGVKVNALIAVLAGEGEDAGAAAKGGGGAAPAQGRGTEGRAPAAEACKQPRRPLRRQRRTRARRQAAARQRAAAAGGARIFASPLARRIAKEAGVDVAAVDGHRPAWPHRQGRRRGGDGRRRRQGRARCQPAAGCRAGGRAAPPSRCRTTQVLKLFEPGSYELVPHDDMRKTIARRLVEAKQTDPAFLPDGRLRDSTRCWRCARSINAAAPGRRPTRAKPGLQALGQRHDHQGAGAGAARRAGCQCLVDRERHGQAQARRCRRRRVDPGRADHADHPQRRRQDAVGDLQRDEGSRRARPRPQAEARGISGRHVGGLQPRHVRHQGLRRHHQPAARDDPGGRRGRGAGGGQERRDRRSRR